MAKTTYVAALFCLNALLVRAFMPAAEAYQQQILNPKIDLDEIATPTVADTVCTPTNIWPTDIARYTHSPYISHSGNSYDVYSKPGWVFDWRAADSLGGVLFGPNGPDANSYGYCVPQCANWCDNNIYCHSFNVFTFQESDYADCQVTCECRAVSIPFDNKTTNHPDYEIGDPAWASLILSRREYCFTQTCCFDALSPGAYDPCLYDHLDVSTFLQNFYRDSSPSQTGILADLAAYYFNYKYDCDITPFESCPLDLLLPDISDPEQITAYLVIVALRRYLLFLSAKRYFVQTSFQQLVSTEVQELVTNLTGSNTKPPAVPQNQFIGTALSLLSSLVSWVAIPEDKIVTDAFKNFASLLGWGSKVADMVAKMQSQGVMPTTTLYGLPSYLAKSSNTLLSLLEDNANDVKTNLTTAVGVLNVMGGGAFNLTPDASWEKPTMLVTQAQPVLRAWTISAIFRALGIFVHSEPHVNAKWPYDGTYKYPGQRIFTKPSPLDQAPTYAFPVYWIVGDDPHDTRIYGVAEALSAAGIDWTQVYQNAYSCQYIYNSFGYFGQNAYPQIDADGLFNTLINNPGRNPTDIPCMFALPVCDAGDKNIVHQCVSGDNPMKYKQKCCTGHVFNPIAINPIDDGDWYHGDWYNDDNFGLDNWCATELGAQTLGKAHAWLEHRTDMPFQGC